MQRVGLGGIDVHSHAFLYSSVQGTNLPGKDTDFYLFPCNQQRRKWQLTPVFSPGESHGQRSLDDCSPWGGKEPDTAETLNHHHSVIAVSVFHFRTEIIRQRWEESLLLILHVRSNVDQSHIFFVFNQTQTLLITCRFGE